MYDKEKDGIYPDTYHKHYKETVLFRLTPSPENRLLIFTGEKSEHDTNNDLETCASQLVKDLLVNFPNLISSIDIKTDINFNCPI